MAIRTNASIEEIARMMKLPTSTITRALDGSHLVPRQVRSKIARVASELGYQHNVSKDKVKPQKSQLLCAMVTQLNGAISSSVVSGAETTASQLGIGVMVNQTLNNPELRSRHFQKLQHYGVDGVLVASAYFQEYDSLNELSKLKIPVVVIEASSLVPARPKKKFSDFENAHELTNHLIEKGCRRITFLSVDLDKTRHADLLSGFMEALNETKVAESVQFVLNSRDVQNPWDDICDTLASALPWSDGLIFLSNDLTAIAYTPSSTTNKTPIEFWLTCRKGGRSTQSQIFSELGKLAAGLLASFSRESRGLSLAFEKSFKS